MAAPLRRFERALAKARGDCDELSLLVGNGFSIACDAAFDYRRLYDRARFDTGEERLRKVFKELSTTDFEVVVQHLESAAEVLKSYSGTDALRGRLRGDATRVRQALADVIADVHPSRISDVGDARLDGCCAFLKHFDQLFSLNYDLLLYWAIQRDPEGWPFRDGFTRVGDRLVHHAPPDQNISWLHGCLHLFETDPDAGTEPVTVKREWSHRTAIVDQVRRHLERGGFPLIVMEGRSTDKRRKIDASPYLRDALERLRAADGALFTFGWGFGANDDHVLEAIAESEITQLHVGLRGERHIRQNARICGRASELRNTSRGRIRVSFYDATSAPVWR